MKIEELHKVLNNANTADYTDKPEVVKQAVDELVELVKQACADKDLSTLAALLQPWCSMFYGDDYFENTTETDAAVEITTAVCAFIGFENVRQGATEGCLNGDEEVFGSTESVEGLISTTREHDDYDDSYLLFFCASAVNNAIEKGGIPAPAASPEQGPDAAPSGTDGTTDSKPEPDTCAPADTDPENPEPAG